MNVHRFVRCTVVALQLYCRFRREEYVCRIAAKLVGAQYQRHRRISRPTSCRRWERTTGCRQGGSFHQASHCRRNACCIFMNFYSASTAYQRDCRTTGSVCRGMEDRSCPSTSRLARRGWDVLAGRMGWQLIEPLPFARNRKGAERGRRHVAPSLMLILFVVYRPPHHLPHTHTADADRR